LSAAKDVLKQRELAKFRFSSAWAGIWSKCRGTQVSLRVYSTNVLWHKMLENISPDRTIISRLRWLWMK
jgi:hypothetical protein